MIIFVIDTPIVNQTAMLEACIINDKVLVVGQEVKNYVIDECITNEIFLFRNIECTLTETYEELIDFGIKVNHIVKDIIYAGRIVLTHVDPNRSRGTP